MMTIVNRTVLVASAVLALSACKKADTSPGSDNGVATSGQPKPRVTSPTIGELLAAVPGNAVAIGFVDLDAAPWSLVTGGGLLPLDEATRKSLDKDLRAYVDRYVGLDLTKLQYAVGFVSGPPGRGAVLVKAIGGTLKMPGATDYEGGTLWVVDADAGMSLAQKGDVAVFGKDQAVREVLDTLAGKRTPVTTDNKALVEWLGKESRGAALAFAAIKPVDLPLPPQVAGLERVAMAVGATGISAVIEADDATLSTLQGMSDQAFARALGEVERAREAALAGAIPPPEGVMAILGAAYAKSYAAKLRPRRDGNRLSVSLELGLEGFDPVAVVAVVGVLSAVAIPAFLQYMKKSKAEAMQLAE